MSSDSTLAINCAKALKAQKNNEIADIMREKILTLNDEFEKFHAYEFLIYFDCKNNINLIIENCINSPFALNIICLLFENNSFIDLKNIINSEYLKNIFQILLEGYPEELHLNTVEYYQIYDFVQFLAEEKNNQYSLNLLYSIKNKFSEYITNSIYNYDLTNETKEEIKKILNFLNNISYSKENLQEEIDAYHTMPMHFDIALNIIKENNYKEYGQYLVKLINDEKITTEKIANTIDVIKHFQLEENINKNLIANIKDENIKALCLSYFN